MSLMDIVVFGGIGLLLAGLAYVGIRKRNRDHDERERRSHALGWRYNRKPGGNLLYAIQAATQGISWKISSDPNLDPNKEPIDRRPSTTWIASNAYQTSSPLIVTNIELARFLCSKDGQVVKQFGAFFTAFLGHEMPQMPRELQISSAGSPRFRSQYAVMAADEQTAVRFLTPDIENAILRWPMKRGQAYTYHRCLSLELNGHDVVVRYFGKLSDMEKIERLADIGIATLNHLFQKPKGT